MKSYIALLSFAALSVAGFVGTADTNAAAESVDAGNSIASSQSDLRTNNSCESPLDTDYMELLQGNEDDSVLFVGCGGVL